MATSKSIFTHKGLETRDLAREKSHASHAIKRRSSLRSERFLGIDKDVLYKRESLSSTTMSSQCLPNPILKKFDLRFRGRGASPSRARPFYITSTFLSGNFFVNQFWHPQALNISAFIGLHGKILFADLWHSLKSVTQKLFGVSRKQKRYQNAMRTLFIYSLAKNATSSSCKLYTIKNQ